MSAVYNSWLKKNWRHNNLFIYLLVNQTSQMISISHYDNAVVLIEWRITFFHLDTQVSPMISRKRMAFNTNLKCMKRTSRAYLMGEHLFQHQLIYCIFLDFRHTLLMKEKKTLAPLYLSQPYLAVTATFQKESFSMVTAAPTSTVAVAANVRRLLWKMR